MYKMYNVYSRDIFVHSTYKMFKPKMNDVDLSNPTSLFW